MIPILFEICNHFAKNNNNGINKYVKTMEWITRKRSCFNSKFSVQLKSLKLQKLASLIFVTKIDLQLALK